MAKQKTPAPAAPAPAVVSEKNFPASDVPAEVLARCLPGRVRKVRASAPAVAGPEPVIPAAILYHGFPTRPE